MTPEDEQQLKAYLKAAAEIIYKNTEPTSLKSFESIEKSLRDQILKEVGPELASFFFQTYRLWAIASFHPQQYCLLPIGEIV